MAVAASWHGTSFRRSTPMFRISTERCAGVPTTVRLAGRLAGDAVEVLIGACVEIGPGVTIDLSEVCYADDAGISALTALRARAAVLQKPRPYLALLLREGASGPCAPAAVHAHDLKRTIRQ